MRIPPRVSWMIEIVTVTSASRIRFLGITAMMLVTAFWTVLLSDRPVCNRDSSSRVLIGSSRNEITWTSWVMALCSLERARENPPVRLARLVVKELWFMWAVWQVFELVMMKDLDTVALLMIPLIGLVLFASRSLLTLSFLVVRILLLIMSRLLACMTTMLLSMILEGCILILVLLWSMIGWVLLTMDSPVSA